LGAVISPSVASLARDRRTRVTHGLEHATIHVLQEMGAEVRHGLTIRNTFMIELDNDGRNWDRYHDVLTATLAAIGRITAGERGIAYAPDCGTSLMVGYAVWAIAVFAAGVAAAILGVPIGITFAGTVAAALAARLSKRALGLAAQHWLTVSTDFVSASHVRVARDLIAAGTRVVFTVTLDVVVRDDRAEPVAI